MVVGLLWLINVKLAETEKVLCLKVMWSENNENEKEMPETDSN